MKTTEIIEKVKQNLKIQESLKEELENDEAKREITEEKIAFAQENLLVAEQDEEVLKVNLIQDLKDRAEDLSSNLSLKERYAYADEGFFGYGLQFTFAGKKYELLAYDYDLTSDQKVENVADFAEKLFEDYMVKGKIIFNEDAFKTLQEIIRLHDLKPEVFVNKLVAMDVDRKVKKFNKKLFDKKEAFNAQIDELKKVEKSLEKAKEFKSEFLKKLFTKKAKLEEKRANIIAENQKSNNDIAKFESVLADKSKMKTDSTNYVQAELKSLHNILEWFDCFGSSKLQINRHNQNYIQVLKNKIQDLKEFHADIQTRIKETKGTLQLNKKVNNEIVLNALMNSDFVESLRNIDSFKVNKEDCDAVNFVENKYDDYLENCVEKIVR